MLFILLLTLINCVQTDDSLICGQDLMEGQYFCDPPVIDADTEQPRSCNDSNRAFVVCHAVEGILCNESGNSTFLGKIDCEFSSGKDWRIALILSIFFGWLGLDRFYLGYFAIGLLKLCTVGFFFIFHLLDIVLIAMQVVGPADRTYFKMDYYGNRVEQLVYSANATFHKTLY